MKSIDLRHRLAAVLLAMCLVVCCALPAFATSANIVLGRLGSLHVRLYDTHNDVPLRGGELTLYQVASVKRTNGNLYFDYTGDFTGCGVVLGDLSDSTLADQLVKYLPAVPAIAAQQDVNEEGYANITKLPQGLYLVVQTEASHGYEAIKPFLVSIPMPDGDNWIYDVDATPKVGATIPETPDTPDTPDVPIRPTHRTPPISRSSRTPRIRPENPDNPVSPSNPDKPVLPQTGQLNWPVPVLACSGVLLFAAGWVLNRQGKKEN